VLMGLELWESHLGKCEELAHLDSLFADLPTYGEDATLRQGHWASAVIVVWDS